MILMMGIIFKELMVKKSSKEEIDAALLEIYAE
jgi:hypothetical protein